MKIYAYICSVNRCPLRKGNVKKQSIFPEVENALLLFPEPVGIFGRFLLVESVFCLAGRQFGAENAGGHHQASPPPRPTGSVLDYSAVVAIFAV